MGYRQTITKQTIYDKRMKTKRLYQSPLIRRDEVELEDGFCGSITNDMGKGVEVTSSTQEYASFDASNAFETEKDEKGNSHIFWE